MRLLIFLSLFILPFIAAAEECPVGYAKDSKGMCARACKVKPPQCGKGMKANEALCPPRCTPACPEGYFYEPSVKLCETRCPNGGAPGVGPNGDVVCVLPERLKKAAKYASNCEKMGRAFIPHLGICGPVDEKKKDVLLESAECARGEIAAYQKGKYVCVKGSAEEGMKAMRTKLQKDGLSYHEYLTALTKAQTNKSALKMLKGRISDLEQYEKEAKEGKPRPVADKIICVQGYVPTSAGECRPEKSCNLYRCLDGKTPEYKKRGNYYYCACDK